jgi:Ca2+-binding EF-hand superfamily protein
MSTMSPQKRQESKVNVIANPAKIDPQRLTANTQLPGDILSDLQDAFMLYDKENTGFICI